MNKLTRLTIVWTLLLLFSLTLLAPIGQAATIIAQPGDVNETVGQINAMLKATGYYYGTVSNTYGTATKSAVLIFQRAHGLTSTGTVDQATYDALKAEYAAKTGNSSVPSTPREPAVPKTPASPSTPTAPVPSSEPAAAPTPKPDSSYTPEKVPGLTADEQKMLDMVNQERAKAGVAPLKIDMRMVQTARAKSKDMIDNNYFSHTSPTLGGFASQIRTATGGDYSAVAENLSGGKTVEAAMKAFMNSAGHRKNILNPKFTHIGIGIVSGGPYGQMYTQHFGG